MDYVSVLFRWVHIVAGIMWIGLLYYFNWMNGHIAATFDADTKKKVVPELMPRVLYWFRWGAAYTWVTGVVLLMLVFYHGGLMFEGDHGWDLSSIALTVFIFLGVIIYDIIFKFLKDKQWIGVLISYIMVCTAIFLMINYGHFSYRSYVIHTGALFGTIMAFNVWFRIWPAQQKIITAIKNGDKPDPALVALAGLRSKHNTYLSVPLVYTMVDAHTTTVGASSEIWLMGAIAVGWLVVFMLYKKSATIQGF